MTDRIDIITLDDKDRWLAETKEFGLPSQSWSYANGLSASAITPKLGIVCAKGARMLLPFYEREWQGTVDISTIVGGSGASVLPCSLAPLSLWREFAVSRGWVAGYIQLSSEIRFDQGLGDEFVCNNTDFLVDVRIDDAVRSASKTIRTKFRDAVRARAVMVDDRRVLLGPLQRLYPLAMTRLFASPHFIFSAATLQRWSLDDESLLVGAAVDGSIEAILMFRCAGSVAEASITGSTEKGRYLVPWLIYEGATRLRARGVQLLNLGGGVRLGDGLYKWKERFHAIRRPRWAARQIYDVSKYSNLCMLAGVPVNNSWFPAYRSSSANGDQHADQVYQ